MAKLHSDTDTIVGSDTVTDTHLNARNVPVEVVPPQKRRLQFALGSANRERKAVVDMGESVSARASFRGGRSNASARPGLRPRRPRSLSFSAGGFWNSIDKVLLDVRTQGL